jgi:hypothetical protein
MEMVVTAAETWQRWSLQQSPLPFTGASSSSRRCHHSFCRRCRCFRCHCHFCCCRLLVIVVAITITPLPLPLLSLSSSLSPSHPPLPSPLLVDCCLYLSAAITASSSSPRLLSLHYPTPALVTVSVITSPPLPLPPL